MKKFLMIAAMIGMVAGQAMAGMVPYNGSNVPVTQLNMADYNIKSAYMNPAYGTTGSDRGLFAAPYAFNDPAARFDNMPVSFGFSGPGTALWFYGSVFPAGRIYWDDFAPIANTTGLSELKWVYADVSGATNSHTQFFQVATGTALAPNTAGVVFSFAISGLPLSGTAVYSFPIDLTFIFGGNAAVPANTQLWFGWSHFSAGGNPTMFGNGFPTVNGAAGDGNSSAFYVGDSGLRACTQSGTSMVCFSSVLSFGSIYTMNFAFNGVPEPSVIGLLAIGGLVALRRRKA